MATYTIDIEEQSEKARHFLNFIKDYAQDNDFVTLEKVPNDMTRKAIYDARNGNVDKVSDVDSLFDSI